jgi:tetratricopeptide (TPR) repeat protein
MFARRIQLLSFLAASLSLISTPAMAQWAWPDSTENLQVLPSHWSGQQLRPVMTGFSRALGVRCVHCHEGDARAPLHKIDFVSDKNPNKERAREMLRMLQSINSHLENIKPSGDQRVNMWCHTCHRGRPRPMTLEEELGETYRLHGIDSALTAYAMLRTNFFGAGAYNFGENALNTLGYEVLGDGDPGSAVRIFTLNAEAYPESANVWDSLAEAYMKVGEDSLAIVYYERSLELNPKNRNAKAMLETLRAGR